MRFSSSFRTAAGRHGWCARPRHRWGAGANVVFDGIQFTALSSGAWANGNLLVDVDVIGVNLTADALAFNLTITDLADKKTEYFANVTLTSTSNNYITNVVNDPDNGSQLVNVSFRGSRTRRSGESKRRAGRGAHNHGGQHRCGRKREFHIGNPGFQSGDQHQFAGDAASPMPIQVKIFGKGTPIPQTRPVSRASCSRRSMRRWR